VELFGNGLLYLTSHARAFSIGSVEGDGIVNLGGVGLTLGTNNLSTAFSGVIEDIGATTGSLGKAGTGIFTLAGANTYTAGTTISAGVLRVTNRAGSGTGAGPVNVTAGTLGGSGTIAGPVTIGSGSGPGASLAPSVSVSRPATLTIQDTLSFKQESSYAYQLNTKKSKADQVTACGVTIENGAEFSFHPIAQRRLALGTSFLIINNTSATPIGGTFANLPDGTVLTVGRNKLQASYEGGDGNDLSLTVVP
jgi:autotransporter-associated beta strand protein